MNISDGDVPGGQYPTSPRRVVEGYISVLISAKVKIRKRHLRLAENTRICIRMKELRI